MGVTPHSLSPHTLDSLDKEYSWKQQCQLEKYFKKELYPDLEAGRDLATRLNLKEEQAETWFIQHSLEKEMRCPITQLTACQSTSSCAHHKIRWLRMPRIHRTPRCTPSWWYRLIPINSLESSTSSYWNQHPKLQELRNYEASIEEICEVLAERLKLTEADIRPTR
ncbi:cone-rod homeobox opposite strand [Cricetulus griseus]